MWDIRARGVEKPESTSVDEDFSATSNQKDFAHFGQPLEGER